MGEIFMKTSTKTVVKCVLFALLYVLIVYAALCLGYLHPFFWAYAATVSALFAAIPYLYLASKRNGFGVETVLALLVALACMAAGEGTMLNYAVILALGIVSDLVRNACGGDTRKGVRTAYPIFALVPFGRTMVLWTDRANELAADAEEMGATYSEAMAKVTPVWMLIVMLAVTILLAIAAERVTEKVMKKTSSALC